MFSIDLFTPPLRRQRYLLILCLLLPALSPYAQTGKPCKAKVRANRGNALVFGNLVLESEEWPWVDNTHVTRLADSVYVRQDGAPLTRFRIKDGHVDGTLYKEFYPGGTPKRVDSLPPYSVFHWRQESYFSAARASVFYTRRYYPTGILQTERYHYRSGGEDSLKRSFYPTGVLRDAVWCYPSGYDSLEKKWYPDGTLYSVKYGRHILEYYPTGIRKSHDADTLIDGQPLIRVLEYYPNGVLCSEEYVWEGEKYLTWRYYDAEGVLVRSVKQPPATKHTPRGWGIVGKERPKVFETVNILPEFPGGEHGLKKYLNETLAPVLCDSPLPLQGRYRVRFTLDTYGHTSFQSIKGENAPGIETAVARCINQLPRWKPGKVDGRPVITTFTLTLEVVRAK